MAAFQTRIGKAFERLDEEQKKGFIAFVTAGDPSMRGTVEIVRRLADVGVDIVELGIPFSDPLADGKVNQAAAERALKAGATLQGVYRTVEQIRTKCDIPILLYSYVNPLYARGFDKAMKQAASAGVDGFLLLDLSMEEAAPYRASLMKHQLDNVCLVTPTSPERRIQGIVKNSTGFVYCVSRTGVTGLRKKVECSAGDVVARTKKATDLPVALGFGISNRQQAAETAQLSDAIVVGSAIVKKFHEAPHNATGRATAAKWVGGLVNATKSV